MIGALAVLGAVLGIVWEAWSPPGPLGVVLSAGIEADESEAFVAGDGRFALITVIVGLVAGVVTWYLRRVRGPYLAVALAVGALAGAALTDLVGWALRGDGRSYTCGDGTTKCIDHLPLTVHMHSLWFLEAAVALLVYSLFVAFAVADDLGRPDVGHHPAHPGSQVGASPQPVVVGATAPPLGAAPSVGMQGVLQNPWRDGDAAGPP